MAELKGMMNGCRPFAGRTMTKRLIVSIAFLIATLAPLSAHAQRLGLRSLLVDPGVTASGMGNAYTAVAEDPSAIYWNVAGLAQGTAQHELLVAHTEWFLDVRQEFAVGVYRFGSHTVAAGISGFYLGGIERREDFPSDEPFGDFAVYDLVVPLAYARAVGDFHVGLAAKPWYSKIDRETAHGIGLDLGAMYHVPALPGARLGLAISNLSSSSDFSGNQPFYLSEEFRLPLDIRTGGSYRYHFDGLESEMSLLVSAQARFIEEQDTRGDFGMEVTWTELLAVRFGYKAGYDLETWSIGATLRRGALAFQYAGMPFDNDFGNSQRLALSYLR